MSAESAALAAELAAARAGLVFRVLLTGELLRVRGADAAAWLQATLSQDLAALVPGQGARSLLLDARATVLADLVVLREEDGYLLVADSDPERPLAAELERRIFREQVELAAFGAAGEQLWLAGPGAADFLRAQLGLAELPAAPLAHTRAGHAGWPLTLFASPRLGPAGYELVFDAACGPQGPELPAAGEGGAGALRRLFQALAEAGARRLSPAAAEYLRIAAGRPRRDPDLARVLPEEAGLVPEAVSLAKGCYPGQEVVMRQASRGRPRWRLQVLLGPGAVPPRGAPLRTPDAESAGWISSAAGDGAGGFVALAYLRAGGSAEGLTLEDDRLLQPWSGSDSH